MVWDTKATTWGGVADCRIEARCKGGVRADSVSSLIIMAGERRGLLGVGFENTTRGCVLGSWNEGPSRDWAWWRLDGWGAGRPRRKEGEWGEGPSLAITTMVCLEFACVCRLSVSMRQIASAHPFCVLIIYMNSYVFHICFILFIFLWNTYLIFDFICLTLSLATRMELLNAHAHTYEDTHTQKRVERVKKKEKGKSKGGGVQGGRKEKQKKSTKRKRGKLKKRGKREKRWGGGQRKKRKRGGWVQGFEGAWVLRRVGPHTNNARSTWMFFWFYITCKRTNNATRYAKLRKKKTREFQTQLLHYFSKSDNKAIIINTLQHTATHCNTPRLRSFAISQDLSEGLFKYKFSEIRVLMKTESVYHQDARFLLTRVTMATSEK